MLNDVDKAYHEVLEELLEAPIRGDRTGTGTRSIFGRQLRFTDLDNTFPLLTTKKVYFLSIFHELKWMLMGDTNIKYLVDNDVSIWTDWPLKKYNHDNHDFPMTKAEFEQSIRMDSNGFAEKWGDCGHIYGYQWRRWSKFTTPRADNLYVLPDNGIVTNVMVYHETVDQIKDVLIDLKSNPESRRMIVSAWNVADIPAMIPSGLPPCHMFMQFYTRPLTMKDRLDRSEKYEINEEWVMDAATIGKNAQKLTDEGIPERYLDCHVYLRSNDWYLGAPFNIAQYALLTHLIAKTVNMVPGELVYTIGDCHLYLNHVEQAKEQLSRSSKGAPPKLVINEAEDDPAKYEWWDLELQNYVCHAPIKAPIAV